jgi:hypothetical protein
MEGLIAQGTIAEESETATHIAIASRYELADCERAPCECSAYNHNHPTAPCIPFWEIGGVLTFFKDDNIDGIEFAITIEVCRVVVHRGAS